MVPFVEVQLLLSNFSALTSTRRKYRMIAEGVTEAKVWSRISNSIKITKHLVFKVWQSFCSVVILPNNVKETEGILNGL